MEVSMSETGNVPQIIQIVTEGWGAFFCIIAAIVVGETAWHDRKKVIGLLRFIVADGLLLLADALATGVQGQGDEGAFYIVKISNLLAYLLGYLVIAFGVSYFGEMVEERVHVSIRNWKLIEYIVAGVGICLILINVFFPFLYDFDSSNQLRRLPWNSLISFSYMLGVILIMVLLLNFFKDLTGLERFAILSALVLPVAAFVLRYVGYDGSLIGPPGLAAVVFTSVSYMIDYTAVIANREREREKWIADEKIRLLYNQIKPHFIYNALTGVYYGMDEDLPRSKKALKDLSGYLRGSLDVLDERECVDFSKELGTVRCYLDVETFRFDDQIHVDIDAQDMDFQVPAFCIQTLVENAVRHGIRKKNPPEGCVSIHTCYEDGEHTVTIVDDGIGFDPEEMMAAEGVHIGLRNTKKRLALMCDGSMEIESKPGEGTKVTLRIPDVKEQ